MRVTPPDFVGWMIDYMRVEVRKLTPAVDVGRQEPDTLSLPMARPLIVIRDDSGPRRDWTTFGRSIGITVLGGSKQNDKPINDLALLVASIAFDDALPLVDESPIARVLHGGCNGPYDVPDKLNVARKYLTAQYVVTGTW